MLPTIKVPEWAWENVLKTPKPSRKGPAFERPREIARLFSNDDFEYIKTRKNGRDVYKDKSKAKVVKVNKALGYWKMIGKGTRIEEDKSTFSLEDAVEQTQSLFDQLELPREQVRDVIKTDVKVSSDPGGESKTIARHVRIHRNMNGYKVVGSRLMVTYGLEGTPFRVEVRWPKFVLKDSANRKDRKKAIDELSEQIAKEIDKDTIVKEIKSNLTYLLERILRGYFYEPCVYNYSLLYSSNKFFLSM